MIGSLQWDRLRETMHSALYIYPPVKTLKTSN